MKGNDQSKKTNPLSECKIKLIVYKIVQLSYINRVLIMKLLRLWYVLSLSIACRTK